MIRKFSFSFDSQCLVSRWNLIWTLYIQSMIQRGQNTKIKTRKKKQTNKNTKHVVLLPKWGARVAHWWECQTTRLPPMWPGFESWCGRHTRVDFVFASLPCSERFFSGYSFFSFSLKTNISKFLFYLERTDTCSVGKKITIYIFLFLPFWNKLCLGLFPLSRNFSVWTHVKVWCVNEADEMYERPRVRA